jgi:hypothetical protein
MLTVKETPEHTSNMEMKIVFFMSPTETEETETEVNNYIKNI